MHLRANREERFYRSALGTPLLPNRFFLVRESPEIHGNPDCLSFRIPLNKKTPEFVLRVSSAMQ